MLCKKVLLEFKKVIAEAKTKYLKKFKKEFPAELAVTLGDCLVVVSTCTRQLLIRVGDDLNKWIREGFLSLVVQHLEEDHRKTEAMSQPLIACGEDRVFRYSGGALGVRDKICW